MRRGLAISALALLALVAGGCYSPQLGTPGFFCHANDNPACPDGQHCVNGRCVSGQAPPSGHDLGSNPPQDFSTTPPQDFGTTPPLDFSTPPGQDMGGSNLCQCSSKCPFTSDCVGPDCCLEDVLLGSCQPSTTCQENMNP